MVIVLEVFGMVAVLADVGAAVDTAAADAAARKKRTGKERKKMDTTRRPSPAVSLASPRGCQRRPAAGGRGKKDYEKRNVENEE